MKSLCLRRMRGYRVPWYHLEQCRNRREKNRRDGEC